ncbi:MAG TPA: RluA family pseudouridine synthase [Caldimonas sp.]|nr:RluA family pseudouridine synthase [Caldimonas sp.]
MSAAAPILHEDAALLVVDKPSGLLTVPGRGPERADCLWARLRVTHAEARIVHRLDEATSGLVVFARTAHAHRRLARAFERREVDKRYVAIVHGCVRADAGSVELPLAPDWPRRPRQRIDVSHGRAAVTHWRVLARAADGGSTRLELAPVTGRTHQLRVHLEALGHPILGDALYAPLDVRARASRLLLHSSRLSLAHPFESRSLVFESPAPF